MTDLTRLIAKQAGSTGFLLLGTGGNLDLEIDNSGTTSTGTRYADIREWIFFAVTYDGTATSGNVRFYKGSRTNSVALLETRTLNQGRALANANQITIGNATSDGSLNRPFDGWLDDVRIFGSKDNASGVLSLQQLEWLRNKDVQNYAESPRLSVAASSGSITLSWPLYPGGFRVESKGSFQPGVDWGAVSGSVQHGPSQNVLTLPATGAQGFFRLVR
jgi:hypothetical protein